MTDKDLIRYWRLTQELAEILPLDVRVPSVREISHWVRLGKIAAIQNKTGGWLVRRDTIPAIAEFVVAVRWSEHDGR